MKRTTTLGFGLGFLGLLAVALPLSCDRFASCEETLSCGKGGEGGASGGVPGSGGSNLGGGGAGTGGTIDPCDTCTGATPICNDAKECVECLESTDCMSASKSLCDTATNTCSGCSGDADCTHLSATPLCETTSQTCIECKSENDCVVGADKFVCAPDTHKCTTTKVHSVDVCQECAHDLDCQVGQYCVEMSYTLPTAGVVGKFCLWDKTAMGAGPNGACGTFPPYAKSQSIKSVDGTDATVCSLATTTCPALNQFRTTVSGCTDVSPTSNDACGATGFNDGRCRLDGDSNPMCTYPCSVNEDCSPGSTCPASGDKYCSL
jgi:hypothetical protein